MPPSSVVPINDFLDDEDFQVIQYANSMFEEAGQEIIQLNKKILKLESQNLVLFKTCQLLLEEIKVAKQE